MLTPEYLDDCTDKILEIYEELQTAIIADMIRRIILMGEISESTAYQMLVYEEAGGMYHNALQIIGKYTNSGDKLLKELFEDAGAHAVLYDDKIYKAAGLNPLSLTLSPSLLQILTAGYEKTKGDLHNMTMTTALSSQRAFTHACNTTYHRVSSGAFSYTEAIKRAVRDLSKQGITTAHYPTGHADKIDVAVRRAVLTGVNQTAAQVQIRKAEELGCDLVETTAHGGARPEHEVWQGKVFSLSGKSKKYQSFKENTGYGTGEGLCGWNCRHNFHPFFDGLSFSAYSDIDLEEMQNKRYEYNGQSLTNYEVTQIQRRYERQIRDVKRELAGYSAAEKAAVDSEMAKAMKETFDRKAVILKNREAKLTDFLKQTGFDRQKDREQVYGFGRSEASKATWANKKRK